MLVLQFNQALLWINLLLGLALLIAMTLSGHAGAVPGSISIYSLLGDWLHLLAASLMVKVLLVGAMLLTSAVHVSLPDLERNIFFASLKKYL